MDAYVLSVDETAGQEMIQHLKDHGFGEARIIKGVRPETAKPTINELDECICAGHYECTAKFCAEGKNAHLIICEDDCRFTVPNAYERILKAIKVLDAHYTWGSLHVGQVPLGPIFPVLGASFLCRTMNPYGAHCYVLNGATAADLMKKIPKNKWRRPDMVEGLHKIPPLERYAFFPSIAIQNNAPKEMRRVFGKAVSYSTGARVIEGLAFTLSGAACILLILATYILVSWVASSLKNKVSKTQ